MKSRGLKEGQQFATLTDIISKSWSRKAAKEYKFLKCLKKENIRHNMTNTKLILNMLAEALTKDISQSVNPTAFDDSKKLATMRSSCQLAMQELEAKSGKKVVTALSFKSMLKSNKKIDN